MMCSPQIYDPNVQYQRTHQYFMTSWGAKVNVTGWLACGACSSLLNLKKMKINTVNDLMFHQARDNAQELIIDLLLRPKM